MGLSVVAALEVTAGTGHLINCDAEIAWRWQGLAMRIAGQKNGCSGFANRAFGGSYAGPLTPQVVDHDNFPQNHHPHSFLQRTRDHSRSATRLIPALPGGAGVSQKWGSEFGSFGRVTRVLTVVQPMGSGKPDLQAPRANSVAPGVVL